MTAMFAARCDHCGALSPSFERSQQLVLWQRQHTCTPALAGMRAALALLRPDPRAELHRLQLKQAIR